MDSISTPIVCPGHQKAIFGLHYSPNTADGYFLISAPHDKLPMLRNATSGDWIGTFEGHKGAVWDAKLNQNATLALTASADFSAILWDATTGQLAHTFHHKHIVRTCAFSNDGNQIVTGSRKKILRIFDLASPEEAVITSNQSSAITRALWMPDASSIVTVGEDSHLRKFDRRTGEIEIETKIANSSILDMELSSDGSMLTLACQRDGVAMLKTDSLSVVNQFSYKHPCDTASLHPDMKTLLVGGADMLVHRIDAVTGEKITSIKGHHGPVHCIRHHPEGTSYASGSGDATIRISQFISSNQEPNVSNDNSTITSEL
jgi:serine-threonine kinase receptor-associated protein